MNHLHAFQLMQLQLPCLHEIQLSFKEGSKAKL